MPRVTGLDGRVFEVNEETLDKCRIPDEQVRSLEVSFDLPEAPPVLEAPPFPDDGPPGPAAAHPWVKVRDGEDGGYVIEITPPASTIPPPGEGAR